MKHCHGCGDYLAFIMFSSHSGTRDGLQTHCRTCLARAQAVSFYRRFKDDPEFWRLVEKQRVYRRRGRISDTAEKPA